MRAGDVEHGSDVSPAVFDLQCGWCWRRLLSPDACSSHATTSVSRNRTFIFPPRPLLHPTTRQRYLLVRSPSLASRLVHLPCCIYDSPLTSWPSTSIKLALRCSPTPPAHFRAFRHFAPRKGSGSRTPPPHWRAGRGRSSGALASPPSGAAPAGRHVGPTTAPRPAELRGVRPSSAAPSLAVAPLPLAAAAPAVPPPPAVPTAAVSSGTPTVTTPSRSVGLGQASTAAQVPHRPDAGASSCGAGTCAGPSRTGTTSVAVA